MERKWIFIVGCYNSGTTLLERILRQHPAIAGLPDEGQFLTSALITPKSVGLPRLWAEKEELFRFNPNEKRVEAHQVKYDWERQLDKPTAPFAVEKSPTNTARTLWLQNHFEGAYFIHIVRNGYAVALGIHNKVLAIGKTFPDLLHKAANQWARSLEIMQEDAPRLKHFLEIRYEDLSEHPTQIVEQLCRFLNIAPIQPDLLMQVYKIHELQSPIVNQNIARLQSMTPEQSAIIYARAGKLLDKYGYHSH